MYAIKKASLLSGLVFTLHCHSLIAAPSVAVDIAPLHSLVSQVMEGVAAPDLIIPAEESPHSYSLRPSQAKSLADAKVVFWMGEALTPWLEKALDNIAGSAQKIEMLALQETILHPFREGATFESHDDHEDEDEQKEEHKDEHSHEGSDPHAWLSPNNAVVWIESIRKTLSTIDPDNAAIYARNAKKSTLSLNALIEDTQKKINALNQPRFIVFHDAYQYFEKDFNISAAGAISLGDAEAPSAARIKEIQATVKELGVTCVFSEPQHNSKLIKSVFEGSNVSTAGVMDPLGASIPLGNEHYETLIKGLVSSIIQCK